MTFNTITSTTKHVLWVEDANNVAIPVTYFLVTRSGCTSRQLLDTLRHFRFACAVVAAGMEWDDGNATMKEFMHREIHPEAVHGEPVCQIYTDGFPVWNGQIDRLPINVFTEQTTAFDTVNDMRWRQSMLAEIQEIDTQLKPAGNAPAPLDLAKEFPRDGNATAPVQPATEQPQPTPGGDHSSPHLGGYDYKKRADYMQYAGQSVSFDVRYMTRAYDRDGNPYIETTSTWNGSTSQYPAHDLKIKANRLEKVDPETRAIIAKVLEGGHDDKHAYRGVFFMYKPDDADRCYPVLSKLELSDVDAIDAKGDRLKEAYEAGEIPWPDTPDIAF